MNVSLTTELESFIDTQVKSGLYHTASEVVRDGLRMLMVRQRSDAEMLADLHREIIKGIEQADRGEVSPLDIEDIKRRGRERIANKTR